MSDNLGTLSKCTATYVWWTEMNKLVIMKIMLIGLLTLTPSELELLQTFEV